MWRGISLKIFPISQSNELLCFRCLELQRKGSLKQPTDGRGNKGSRCKCPFYKQSAISVLGDNALLQVMDIEQLVISGRKVKGVIFWSNLSLVA